MNSNKYPIRLSSQKKLQLIERALNGESVTKLCLQNGISRTIFYRWLKEFKASKYNEEEIALSAKYPKGSGHFRKLKIDKENEIIDTWLNNPKDSIRNIARKARISTGSVWSIIDKYKNSASDEGKVIKRYKRQKYRLYTPSEKIAFISRHKNGESITALCTKAGVSRTIFYRWMRQYMLSDKADLALERKYPKGENHWRFIPGIRDLIQETITFNPKLSLTEILETARSRGQFVSRTGVYYMLKSMGLTTYEARLAYSESQLPKYKLRIGSRSRPFIGMQIPNFLPRFALMSAISIIAVYILLFALVFRPPLKIAPPTATNPTETLPEKNLNDRAVSGQNDEAEPKRMDQDLRWGALAINSSGKGDSYSQGAEIGLGVVDHHGQTICNAGFSLEITGPGLDENSPALTTENGGIRPSGECSIRSVTNTADYLADIPKLDKDGTYNLRLTARTYEGEKEFNQTISIKNNLAIDVERSSYPTRIFPEAVYPVEVVIIPDKDFSGTITETLPKGLSASNISDGGIIYPKNQSDERILSWNKEFKKGKRYKITYNLHFPKIWPEFYEIGPMKFIDKNGKLVFQEAKYWQVVSDSL